MMEKLLERLRGVAPECPQEAEVLRARRARVSDPVLSEHLRTCPRCAELARVVDWMHDLAETGVAPEYPLPAPERIWSLAQLAEIWEAERRAVAPIETVERAEPVMLIVALVVLATLAWPMLQRWLQMGAQTDLTSGLVNMILLVGGGGLLLLLVMLVALRRELV